MDWLSKDIFTATAATVAAVTGVLTFIGNIRRDRILVRYDTVQHECVGHQVLIQNLSPFDVHLYEVGFITKNGELFSVTELQAEEDRLQTPVGLVFFSGKVTLPPREKTTYAYESDMSIIGAYALTTTQKFYRIHFDKWQTSFVRRLKSRLMLFWRCL